MLGVSWSQEECSRVLLPDEAYEEMTMLEEYVSGQFSALAYFSKADTEEAYLYGGKIAEVTLFN